MKGVTRRVTCALTLAVVLPCWSSASMADSGESTVDQGAARMQGGWNYDCWRTLAVQAADKLADTATDHYGARQTPVWVSGLDPTSGSLIEQKPPNWQTYWEAEDYVMTVQGCNLQRDLPTLTAFEQLTQITGDARYDASVKAYLGFWMKEFPSPKTGLFPWGEHMSYNCARDTLIATRHELEQNPPDWNLLWSINPDAVRREIEAIHAIHIWDKDLFLFDRHGNYYTGEFDPPPVRGGYIKHSGLYVHAFMFLFSKTGEQRYLDWARKMSDLYWRHRAPETNLIYGYVCADGASQESTASLLLADYLLEAVRIFPDAYVKERALGIVDAFLKYGYNAETGDFAGALHPQTGEASQWEGGPWQHSTANGFYAGYAIWNAYEVTHDVRYLAILQNRLRNVAHTAIPENVTPGAVGCWLQLYVKAYRATGDTQCLKWARSLADWAANHLLRDGYILEAANGFVYLNYGRPGDLLTGWLDLYQVEQEHPIHWKTSPAIRPGDAGLDLHANGPAAETARLVWTRADGTTGWATGAKNGSDTVFTASVPKEAAQGPMALIFIDPTSGKLLDTGSVLVAENPDGPAVGPPRLPAWCDTDKPVDGDVSVTDPSGVVGVEAVYAWPDGTSGRVTCVPNPTDKNLYLFTVPPAAARKEGALTVRIEAKGNPAWPVSAASEPRTVLAAQAKRLSFTNGQAATEGDLDVALDMPKPPDTGRIVFHWLAALPTDRKTGLPEATLPNALIVEADVTGPLRVQTGYSDQTASELLPGSIGVYRLDGAEWQPLSGTTVDAAARRISFDCPAGGGTFAFGGTRRLAWRRSFSGALLTSPALARLDADGTPAIILTTGPADGIVYALTAKGDTLWKYEAGGGQPFPAVADMDGDNIDEIAIGGTALVLLASDGKPRWKVDLPKTLAPAIGDVNADGKPEVIAASLEGAVVAISASGQELWRTQANVVKSTIPALARLVAPGTREVLVGVDGALLALAGDGKLLWKAPLDGSPMLAPAIADVNGDGLDEIFAFSRNDKEGYLTALDAHGQRLWNVTISREGDWSPVVAPMDGKDSVRIFAQLPDPKKVGLFDEKGQLVRTLDTTGRMLQSPVPLDLDGDAKLDVLMDNDLSYRLWALANDGRPLWSYTPHSLTLPGAKIKLGGSLLVADLDGDGKLEIVGGDDETWLNMVRTEVSCKRYHVVSGQYHGNCQHTGTHGY